MKKQLSVPMTVLIVIVGVCLIGWLAYRNFGTAGGGVTNQAAIDQDVNQMKESDSKGGSVPSELLAGAKGMGSAPSGGGGKRLPGQ